MDQDDGGIGDPEERPGPEDDVEPGEGAAAGSEVETEVDADSPTDSPVASRAPEVVAAPADFPDDAVEAAPVRGPIRLSPNALRAILGGAALLALVAAAGIYLGYSIKAEEADAWAAAERANSSASYRAYIAWADETEGELVDGFLAARLTPLAFNRDSARGRELVRLAHEAVEREDWPALCALIEEHPGTDAASRAEAALGTRASAAAISFRQLASGRGTPPIAIGAVSDAITWIGQHRPCGGGATIRLQHHVADGGFESLIGGRRISEHLTALLDDGRADAMITSVSTDFSALTGSLLAAHRSENVVEGEPLDVLVTVRVEPNERFATPGGATLPGIRFRVHTTVAGPEVPGGLEAIPDATYALPESFAIEFFRARGDEGGDEAAVYARMVEMLYPRVQQRLAQVLAIEPYALTTTSAYGTCSNVRVLPVNRAVTGNTTDEGDYEVGSCVEVEEDSYDDYDGEPETAPEVAYRLVITEPSEVGVAVDAEFVPAVYIRRECSTASTELACVDADTLATTLDEGVYFLIVDASYVGEAGEFEVYASVNTAETIARACAGATPLTLGQPVSGGTGGHTDALHGTCGGVGGNESLYTFHVDERARLRCTTGRGERVVLYARTECSDRDSEMFCVAAPTDAHAQFNTVAAPGDFTVAVDTALGMGRQAYTLTCETAPLEGREGVPADRCEVPGVLDLRTGQTEVEVDTFAAHDDRQATCGGRGAPDVTYRFEVDTPSWFSAEMTTAEAFRGQLSLFESCEASRPIVCEPPRTRLARHLAAGTYYLTVDGGTPAELGIGRLRASLAAVAPACRDAAVLRPGEPLDLRVEPGALPRFAGECGGGGGPEAVARFTVPTRSRVSLAASGAFGTIVHVRRQCADAASQLYCGNRTGFDQVLDPGTYFVFVDTDSAVATGAARLTLELASPLPERVP